MKLKPGFKALLILSIAAIAGFGLNTAIENGMFKDKPAEVVEITATPEVQPQVVGSDPASLPPVAPQTSAPAVNAGLANLLQAKKH